MPARPRAADCRVRHTHACCVPQHTLTVPSRRTLQTACPVVQVFGSGSTTPQFAEASVQLKAFLADHGDAATPRALKAPVVAATAAPTDSSSQPPGPAPPPGGGS